LIPKGVRAFGLLLAALVMSLSVFYGIWVLKNRETYVIRASQPVFLVQLCIGTFIIGLTIIPMSFQEDLPKSLLDISCMSVPWFFAIGFTVAISALFTKARRINKLLNSGSGFRRVQVKAQHVMRPFFIMLAINVILLTAWTASPWHLNWNRIDADNSFDQFGRIVESYGVCRANGKLHFLFSIPLVVTNIIILFLATYQSYQAKDLPTEFSETLYLSFTMIGLTETFIIGSKYTYHAHGKYCF
jgi:gamma-aminobutyric acid type B receptor